MAAADYYLCDICEQKCFYDANLNWECSTKDDPIPLEEQVFGMDMRLDYCGDIMALCRNCAKTHELRIVPKGTAMGSKGE